MVRKIFTLLIVIAAFAPVFADTYTYSDYQDFKGAVTGDDLTPQPGDEFILADGTYSKKGTITIEGVHGTEENPIIIRAESIGGVVFTEALAFDLRVCSHIIIQGFNFELTTKSNVFKLQACNNVRITQNTLDGATETVFDEDGDRESAVWISIQGKWDDDVTLSHHNHVDHNVFKNKSTLGNIIKVDGTNETQVSQYDVIEYNYFKNVGPRADNEMEAIRIGWSAMSESDGYCTVQYNLFEECSGDPEIISVKCNKNYILNNTFRRCAGTLSLRHGNGSIVDGNFFLGEGYTESYVEGYPDSGDNGSGGVRFYGQDHVITNNYFEGLTGTKWDAPITLTYGDADAGGGLTNHHRIENAIIANNTLVNNTYGIEIGYDNSGKYSKPPRNVVIAYNIVSGSENSLVNYINEASEITWIDNILHATGTAVIGEGASFTGFTSDEAIEVDPNLVEGALTYEASASTPTYTPASAEVGSIETDIDGEERTFPTNYGADHYIDGGTKVNRPLNASDVGPAVGEYIYVSKTVVSVDKGESESAVAISANVDWKASSAEDWITIAPETGSADGSFVITIAENTTGVDRVGSVSVESTNGTEGTITETIVVNQSAVYDPVLTLSNYAVSISADSYEEVVDIVSNLSWTAISAEDWITVDPAAGENDGSITVKVAENESVAERVGSIVVSDGGVNAKTITVTQAGYVGPEVKIDIVSVEASTEQAPSNIADNVFDNILENRWSAEGDDVYIDLNLGAVYEVSFLKVGLYKGSERVTFIDIQTSEDGVNFVDAAMGLVTPLTSDDYAIFDFDDIDAQYVRVLAHGTSTDAEPDINAPTGLWNSFTEFEVWGLDDGTTSVVEVPANISAGLYPNPSQGNFVLANCEGADIKIFNTMGNVVYAKSNIGLNETVNTQLASGVYLVFIQLNEKQETLKLVIE